MIRKIIKYLILLLLAAVAAAVFLCGDEIDGILNGGDAGEADISGQPFNPQLVRDKARALSRLAYSASDSGLPGELKDLDYDQHRDIRFVRENGPWYNQRRPFEIQFFHLGALFTTPVVINEVVGDKVRPFKYSPAYFNYGKNNLNGDDFVNLNYAGFRLHYPLNSPNYFDELVSFLGASYFRALGSGQRSESVV